MMIQWERMLSIAKYFKTTMLKPSLYNYIDTYIPVKRPITVFGGRRNPTLIPLDRSIKQAVFKYCAAFTDGITEMNNTQVDNAKDLDVVMSMYNFNRI